MAAAESSLIVGDVNIAEMSDEELFERLTAHGAIVGPIVGTTRKTYQRKLAVLMGSTVSNFSFTDSVNTTNDEMDVEPSQAYINQLSSTTTRRRNVDTAYEPMMFNEDDDDGAAYDESDAGVPHNQSYGAGKPLYTPSPRKPLRSADSSYDSSYRHQESYLNSPLSSSATAAEVRGNPSREHQQKEASSLQSFGSGMLLKIIIAVALAALVYFFFVAGEKKDAFASLEHLAQTAADAIEKKKGAATSDL